MHRPASDQVSCPNMAILRMIGSSDTLIISRVITDSVWYLLQQLLLQLVIVVEVNGKTKSGLRHII